MSETSLIFDLASQIRAIHAGIDNKTRIFQSKTALRCLPGCGKCCLSPTIEAHVSEMLPLAIKLVASGEAPVLHDRLAQQNDPTCALYRPNSLDPSKGYCAAYELRPIVCRLFGFAAVSGKQSTQGQLSTCRTIKETDPQAVQKAIDLIDGGEDVPYAPDFSLQIQLLAPGTAYSERLPINEAIRVALEKCAFLPQYAEDSSLIHETPHSHLPINLVPSA